MAPWRHAAPLALLLIAVLGTALVVADEGGWRLALDAPAAITTYAPLDEEYAPPSQASIWLQFHGSMLFVALSLLLVGAALAGLRWLSVLLVASLGGTLIGWKQDDADFGYRTAVFREVPSGSDDDGQLSTSIAVYGVVGLLVGVALLIAIVWAINGPRTRGRTTASEAAIGRRPARRSAAIGALLIAVMLVAPRAANTLAVGMNSLLGIEGENFDGGAQTIYLLLVAIVATYLGAFLLPKRAPALSVALVLLGIALWIPAVWLFGGIALGNYLPLEGVIGTGPAVLLLWGYTTVAGALLAGRSVVLASRRTSSVAS